MPDNIKQLLNSGIHLGLPFMIAKAQEGSEKVNITRMVEALLIALVVGGGSWFMLIPEIKAQFKYLSQDVQELKDDIKGVNTELNHIEKRVDTLSVDVVRDRFTRTDFENWRKSNQD